MLQQEKPKDYVIATGKQHSVREFIIWTANALGIQIKFKGEGVNEKGIVTGVSGDLCPCVEVGKEIVRINSRYFRPSEVETLLGDASKAERELGWKSQITAEEMCKEMVMEDYKEAKRVAILKKHNLEVPFSIDY